MTSHPRDQFISFDEPTHKYTITHPGWLQKRSDGKGTISVTTLIMLGGGKYIAITDTDTLLCIVLCIIANTVFLIHIPKGTIKNPYSQEYSHLQKKRLSIVSALLTIIAFFVKELRATIVVAMFLVAIFLLPELIHRFQATE